MSALQVHARCRYIVGHDDEVIYVVVDLYEDSGNIERRTSLVFENADIEDVPLRDYVGLEART